MDIGQRSGRSYQRPPPYRTVRSGTVSCFRAYRGLTNNDRMVHLLSGVASWFTEVLLLVVGLVGWCGVRRWVWDGYGHLFSPSTRISAGDVH